MYPEDRVLIGVINTKRDLKFARESHWYRIPQVRLPRGIYAEYVAFFLSGKVFGEQSGTIPYYARRRGVELAHRHELIPTQPGHKRANNVYYKVGLEPLQAKQPPITNPTRRTVAFIHTTWDRFVGAAVISDLYSQADYFVDRIYHALRSPNVRIERFWEADQYPTGYAPQLRIICQRGKVVASTDASDGGIYLDASKNDDELLAEVRAEIARHDGPYIMRIP